MRQIRVIIKHEFLNRMTSKAAQATFAIFMILIVGGPWVPRLISASPKATIGIYSESGSTFSDAKVANLLLHDAASKGIQLKVVRGSSLSYLQGLPGYRKLNAVVGVTPNGFRIYTLKNLNTSILLYLETQAQTISFDNFLETHPSSSMDLRKLIESKTYTLIDLESKKKKVDVHFLWVSIIALALLYWIISFSITLLLTGIVEEKSSRVMEIILSSTSALQLFLGKLGGIYLFALANISLTISFGLTSAYFAGSLKHIHLTTGTLLQISLWFIAALLFYGILLLGLGAIASKTEDLGLFNAPIMIILSASVYSSIFAINQENYSWVRISTFIPPLSFFLELQRSIFHVSSVNEELISISIAVMSILLIAKFSFNTFKRNLLNSR